MADWDWARDSWQCKTGWGRECEGRVKAIAGPHGLSRKAASPKIEMASSFDHLVGISIDGLFLNYVFREVPLNIATAIPSCAMVSSVQTSSSICTSHCISYGGYF